MHSSQAAGAESPQVKGSRRNVGQFNSTSKGISSQAICMFITGQKIKFFYEKASLTYNFFFFHKELYRHVSIVQSERKEC